MSLVKWYNPDGPVLQVDKGKVKVVVSLFVKDTSLFPISISTRAAESNVTL